MAANPKPIASLSDQAVRADRAPAPFAEVLGDPWHAPSPGDELSWQSVQRFAGPLEAFIVAGRLECEGIPARVVSSLGVDLSGFAEVLVPQVLARRALWILAWPPVPEADLDFLATGL